MNTKDEALKQIQDHLINSNFWTTCLNCDEWDSSNEKCLTYDQRPPATVIVKGCQEWIMLIPF